MIKRNFDLLMFAPITILVGIYLSWIVAFIMCILWTVYVIAEFTKKYRAEIKALQR